MNVLLNLIKKELRELITKSTVLSVVCVIVLFIVLGTFIGNQVGDSAGAQKFGYINPNEGDMTYGGYSTNATLYVKDYYVTALKVSSADDYVVRLDADWNDPDSILRAMESSDVNTVVIFKPDFDEKIHSEQRGEFAVYWNQTNTSLFSTLDTATAELVISLCNTKISTMLLSEYGGSMTESQRNMIMLPTYCPADAGTGSIGSTFLRGTLHENVSPQNIYSAMSQSTTFVPIIIMLIITMIGSILISSMGNEKENKTLETLLTLPISRTTVVAGKLIGCAIAGILLGALYMVGMYFYIDGLTSAAASNISMDDLGLVLTYGDWALIVLCIFLAILSALGMCMILGAFAKNYKAAQTYVLPIAVLAIIPMFVTMFSSYESLPMAVKIFLFAIPFSHPMMIIQNLVFGDVALAVGGIVYLVFFTFLTMFITVKLYKSDILLTGIVKKKNNRGIKEEDYGNE